MLSNLEILLHEGNSNIAVRGIFLIQFYYLQIGQACSPLTY